jgi:hypothetical protein
VLVLESLGELLRVFYGAFHISGRRPARKSLGGDVGAAPESPQLSVFAGCFADGPPRLFSSFPFLAALTILAAPQVFRRLDIDPLASNSSASFRSLLARWNSARFGGSSGAFNNNDPVHGGVSPLGLLPEPSV